MICEHTNRQIVECAAQGAAAPDIANELGIDLATVNLVLAAHGKGSDRDITDEQLLLLRARAFNLAMQEEDKSVAFRATQYLIDRDKPKQQQTQSPMIVINNAIQEAHEKFAKLTSEYSDNIVKIS